MHQEASKLNSKPKLSFLEASLQAKAKLKAKDSHRKKPLYEILQRNEIEEEMEANAPNSGEMSLFDLITIKQNLNTSAKAKNAKKKPVAPKPTKSLVKNPNPCASERIVHLTGKERRTPKKKKLTKLKQVINEDRRNFYQTEKKQEGPQEPLTEEPVVDDGKIEDASATKIAIKEPTIPPRVCAREYCDSVISKPFNILVEELLSTLYRFQVRAIQKAPKKAKKRVILGVREVERSIVRNRSKAVIIAYNLEQSESLDKVVSNMMEQAEKRAVPVIFALKKTELGRAVGKKMNMSFASIDSADGAYELFKKVVQQSKELRTEKQQIDKWLLAADLNDCGDPNGTVYTKNPLQTANTLMDKYRFVVRKFPNKPWQNPLTTPEASNIY